MKTGKEELKEVSTTTLFKMLEKEYYNKELLELVREEINRRGRIQDLRIRKLEIEGNIETNRKDIEARQETNMRLRVIASKIDKQITELRNK